MNVTKKGTIKISKKGLEKNIIAYLQKSLKEKNSSLSLRTFKTLGRSSGVLVTKNPSQAAPKIAFVETYRLTTYPGDYGAGKTVQTFSLLPSEETQISIKTWKSSTETFEESASIFDSYTEESANEFEEQVQQESSNTEAVEDTMQYYVEAEASANWGCGSASVGAGVSGGTNSSREEFSKNVMNAAEKHSQAASTTRETTVNTSTTQSSEEGEESTIVRNIKNLNASRTLNFVFRELIQEFHSIFHLVDVRVAFYNGYGGSLREYALYEIDKLVEEYMNSTIIIDGNTYTTVDYIKSLVLEAYGENKIFDYQGEPRQLVEEKSILVDNDTSTYYTYLRVIPPRKEWDAQSQKYTFYGQQEYVTREEKITDGEVTQAKDVRYVDGVILSAKQFTMKTDGVIVESLLGEAAALDDYALNTQVEVLKSQQLENDKTQMGLTIIENLINAGDNDRAVEAYEKFFGLQQEDESTSEDADEDS